jgi:hypothetical protein
MTQFGNRRSNAGECTWRTKVFCPVATENSESLGAEVAAGYVTDFLAAQFQFERSRVLVGRCCRNAITDESVPQLLPIVWILERRIGVVVRPIF